MLNLMLSRNWARFVYPMVPVFFFVYCMKPLIQGNIDVKHYQNYQHESVYYKYGANRPVNGENTITRIA